MTTFWQTIIRILFPKQHPEHLITGRQGEKIALKFLRKQKMRLLKKNFRSGKGELDLVMQDGPELVFVEVKTRSNEGRYAAETAVDREKQKMVIKTARHFINRYRLHKHPCRYDIVAVVLQPDSKPEIRHTKDAFASNKKKSQVTGSME